jgi:carboxyl-terminal processing protease
MLNELIAIGQRNKVKPDYQDLKRNKKIFQLHVKAQIARRIWGNDGLFPIINETNEIFLQSLKLFERMPELNRQAM